MSIASEITRLQSDSAAIAAAIAAKGVTVPSGSGFDDYATLIGSISGGGGGGSVHIATIEATGSSGVSQQFTGLLGEPKMFAIENGPLEAADGSQIGLNTTRLVCDVIYDGTTVFATTGYRSGSTAYIYRYQNFTFTYSNGTLTVTSPGTSTGGTFRSGQYKLIYVY